MSAVRRRPTAADCNSLRSLASSAVGEQNMKKGAFRPPPMRSTFLLALANETEQ